MVTIERSADCGNSPKNQFAEALAIALETGDAAVLEAGLVADAGWVRVGRAAVTGRDAVLENLAPADVAQVSIDRVVTHGKAGAVNGHTRLASGECIAFCHVFTFSSAKADRVKAITSYLIPV